MTETLRVQKINSNLGVQSFDMESKTVGNQIDDEYTDWTWNAADFWRIENDYAHTGSQSSSLFFQQNTNLSGNYVMQTSADKVTLEAWIMCDQSVGDVDPIYFNLFLYDTNLVSYCEYRIRVVAQAGINKIVVARRIYGGSYVNIYGTNTVPITWGTDSWFGLLMVVDANTNKLEMYLDVTDSDSWSYYGSVDLDEVTEGPWGEFRVNTWAHINRASLPYDVFYVDDVSLTYQYITSGAQYYCTMSEFYLEESNIGGGYIVLPDKNVDLNDYYQLQEQAFIMYDSVGNVLFTGMFDHPSLIKDGVRFEIREITQQLNERVCRRNYLLDSGTAAEVDQV